MGCPNYITKRDPTVRSSRALCIKLVGCIIGVSIALWHQRVVEEHSAWYEYIMQ